MESMTLDSGNHYMIEINQGIYVYMNHCRLTNTSGGMIALRSTDIPAQNLRQNFLARAVTKSKLCPLLIWPFEVS